MLRSTTLQKVILTLTLLSLMFVIPGQQGFVRPARAAVTIRLAAPNQWNNSGTSFGPAWETAIAEYEKLNPDVKVEITVLPLDSFYETTSTQLAAGTAPDIVFNQARYRPEMVIALDDYLNQPNPYAPEKAKWIDWFDSRAYSTKLSGAGNGKLYWVPLNLVSVGLFINEDAFEKAGVTAPLNTWEDWRAARPKFKAAGYAPFAMDNSQIGLLWPYMTVTNMMLAKYFDAWNLYDSTGAAGTNDVLTQKSVARAVLTGELTANLPEFAEALNILKEIYEQDATPNWSGIKGLSGAGVALPDFFAGRAAMTLSTNFGVGEIETSKPNFKVGSAPWPTITNASSELATDEPARFGVSAGGTSYMIPASTTGDQLKYAVDFLQFMTAPKYNQPWITTTKAPAAILNVQTPAEIAGFAAEEWGKTPRINLNGSLQALAGQVPNDTVQIVTGYLLGSATLADTQAALDALWVKAARNAVKENAAWQGEDWAK